MEDKQFIIKIGISEIYRTRGNWLLTGRYTYPVPNGIKRIEKTFNDSELFNLLLNNTYYPVEYFPLFKEIIGEKQCRGFEDHKLYKIAKLDLLTIGKYKIRIPKKNKRIFLYTPLPPFGKKFGECRVQEIKEDELVQLVKEECPSDLSLLTPYLGIKNTIAVKKEIHKQEIKERRIRKDDLESEKSEKELEVRRTIIEWKVNCIKNILKNETYSVYSNEIDEDIEKIHLCRQIFGGMGSSQHGYLEFAKPGRSRYAIIEKHEVDDVYDDEEATVELMEFSTVFDNFGGFIIALFEKTESLQGFKKSLEVIQDHIEKKEERNLIEKLLSCL